MASMDYWRKRAEADMDAVQSAASERIARMGKAARMAADELNEEVKRIIGRYAKRFDLSREEAEAVLRAPSDEDSRAYGYRMSRAEALKKEIDAQTEALARLEAQQTREQRKDTAQTVGQNLSGRLQSAGLSFSMPDADGMLKAIGTSWKGASYSWRIWNRQHELAKTLNEEITSSFLSGKSNAQIEQVIMDRFGVNFRQAEALVRTETSYVCNRAEMETYKAAGIDEYEYLTCEDSRTCKICAPLNGQRFKVKDAQVGKNMPPMHTRCRCTTVGAVESALSGPTREEARQWVTDGSPEDLKALLQNKRMDGTIALDTKEAGSACVRYVGKIDREIYKCVTPDITTDEVVITEERVRHIFEEHPQKEHARVLAELEETLAHPDYILQDSHIEHQTDTAIVLKLFQNDKSGYRTILRLATSADSNENKNSIITSFFISEKKWEKYLRNKTILYKRE